MSYIQRQPLLERLLARTVLVLHPTLGSCWIWEGHCTDEGYGRVYVSGGRKHAKHGLVHRVAWLELRGLVPFGKVLDHQCERQACWNPDHLAPDTIHGNASRSPRYNGTKTHCKRGHPLSGSNLHWVKRGGRHGKLSRACRTCGNAAASAYRQRRRQGGVH